MKTIRLEITKEMPSYMVLDIIDRLEEGGRRRGAITMDYSIYDLKPLVQEGRNLEGAIDYYGEWITNTLRRYLLTDCQVEGGYEEILSRLRPHIAQYFQ